MGLSFEGKVLDEKKTALLVKVAQMYYEEGLSQEEISKNIGLSRPYVSRLLTDAKEMGIVQFKVLNPLKGESDLERRIRTKSHLEKVIVSPITQNTSRMHNLSKKAVEYLEDIVQNGDIIGFSWGTTIFSVTNLLGQKQKYPDIVAAQLCGGISNLEHDIYCFEIARNFSKAWEAKPYVLTCPAIVSSKRLKEAFLSDSNINKVMSYGYDSNIALMTMGTFGLQSSLYRAGYLNEKEVMSLIEKGAIGDICTHVIDAEGNICDKELDERTMSVPLDVIKKKKIRIGVACGQSKVDSIYAAIKAEIINVLIIDEETAGYVLERL
ncbi:sugar-binding transcriptional regulator [Faecalicatena contorta]|uniref:sugar-binding transcriptional regulator n=1 Tax=Faecalicatena contorta TaxID=39482 RepID=UPI001F459759|nr:sugar-binding transcriptional regulator [Faecalicatena contorta]MCF2555404.1 sugar-binding transcriptional regulator [Faecalicatena contorta]